MRTQSHQLQASFGKNNTVPSASRKRARKRFDFFFISSPPQDVNDIIAMRCSDLMKAPFLSFFHSTEKHQIWTLSYAEFCTELLLSKFSCPWTFQKFQFPFPAIFLQVRINNSTKLPILIQDSRLAFDARQNSEQKKSTYSLASSRIQSPGRATMNRK
jgi:hypothetical protein